jgi:ABC-2 type transport system permease protein
MNFTRLLAIAWKELIQLRRDRISFGLIIGIPLIQLSLFGYAINTNVRHIPLGVVDENSSASSRDLVRSIEASGSFTVKETLSSRRDIEAAMKAGRVQAVIVIPSDYEDNLARRITASVQLILDGTDPQIVSSATVAAQGFFSARAEDIMVTRINPIDESLRPLRFEPITWYNPELRSAVFIVPGLMGMILTNTLMMYTAMAIARERERGTMEQLIVSPVKRLELILGKILPYILIGYVQVTVILLAGALLFHLPIRGSLPFLYLIAFEFIAANLALGIFLSTIAATQQQAMQLGFLIILPNILLSGYMFPFQAMPEPAQWIGSLLPNTHFLRIVRAVILKDSGFMDLWREIAELGVILTGLVTLATLRFQKTLD